MAQVARELLVFAGRQLNNQVVGTSCEQVVPHRFQMSDGFRICVFGGVPLLWGFHPFGSPVANLGL